MVCVNVELVKHAKAKELVHIVTQTIINANAQKMLMLVLTLVKPANQEYVSAVRPPAVLVKLPERIVMLQITNVNVRRLYLLVQIQEKLVTLELASVELLQLVLVRHLDPFAMRQIMYVNVHQPFLLVVEPRILVIAVYVSGAQVARVAIQENLVVLDLACVGLHPLVPANQLEHIVTLIIMYVNAHLQYLLVRVERNVQVERAFVSEVSFYFFTFIFYCKYESIVSTSKFIFSL